MLCTTSAIVLSYVRHTDSSAWLHLYTKSYGRMCFLVYGRKYRPLFTPMALLEICADIPSTTKPASLRSASLLFTPTVIPTDHHRQCIALFLSEIIASTLPHPLQDEQTFQWLTQQIYALDNAENIVNLHITFLQQYTYLLGIGIDPQTESELLVSPTSDSQRRKLIRQLCAYYREHIDDFILPKSLEVLTEVFE